MVSFVLYSLAVFFFLALGAGILFLIFSLARYFWRKSSSNVNVVAAVAVENYLVVINFLAEESVCSFDG